MRIWWTLPIVVFLMIGGLLSLSSCGQEKQTATPEPSPKGSVIEKICEQVRGATYGEYGKQRITARIMNIGGDGVIKVTAGIGEGDVIEPRSVSTELYLKKGEEKTITFDFWVKGVFRWGVFCIP